MTHSNNRNGKKQSKTKKSKLTRPELLAPAGSLNCFHAAVEAGADAIYLGLDEFNARLRAKNFSLKTLSYLVPFAHKNNIKIYIALNTLIKQHELQRIMAILCQLEQLEVDAVIIQDLSIVQIITRYFPGIPLHASTQMVVHNTVCATALEKLGIKRIILARELSLAEIGEIKKTTNIELEVFIHGALCYSISGLCLASSYIGGSSGNRGCCMQVCRRQFTSNKKSQYFFSPKDFCTVHFIPELMKLDIKCFKIEGRMKNADYVYNTVSAYRKLIDNPDLVNETQKLLKKDFGREKTSLFLSSQEVKHGNINSYSSGTGEYLGIIKEVSKDYFNLKTDTQLKKGDKIRIHQEDINRGYMLKILKVIYKEGWSQIYVSDISEVKRGYNAYLVGPKSSQNRNWSHYNKITIKPSVIKKRTHSPQKMLEPIMIHTKKKVNFTDQMYLRINTIEWLRYFTSISPSGVIIQCSIQDLKKLKAREKILSNLAPKLIISLPPFIPQHTIPIWKKTIAELYHAGIIKWMCSQFGEKQLFPDRCEIFADYPLWCINRVTQNLLLNNGFSSYYFSPEDDILNLKAIGNQWGLMPLYLKVPLFVSRIDPALPDNTFLKEKQNYRYIIKKKFGLWYLLSEKPLCLTHRRDKLKSMGIKNFVLDLSFHTPQRKTLSTILSYYSNKTKVPDTSLFNHKAGLK
ncbi:MAG: peptidase U32 family protein [Chitinispirillia bacterium]|jgi:putative protease